MCIYMYIYFIFNLYLYLIYIFDSDPLGASSRMLQARVGLRIFMIMSACDPVTLAPIQFHFKSITPVPPMLALGQKLLFPLGAGVK